MPNEGTSALATSKATAHKFIDMAIKYLLPLGTFFVGVLTGAQTWGGVNALYGTVGKTLGQADPNNSGAPTRLLAAGLYGGIFGATGYAFWGLDNGMIGRAVGRGFGGYFFGTAVGYLLILINNDNSAPDGLIDNLVADLQGL